MPDWAPRPHHAARLARAADLARPPRAAADTSRTIGQHDGHLHAIDAVTAAVGPNGGAAQSDMTPTEETPTRTVVPAQLTVFHRQIG